MDGIGIWKLKVGGAPLLWGLYTMPAIARG